MARVGGSKQETRESYWRRRIAACESSGKSIVQYCRDAGVPVSTYSWWKGELKRRDGAQGSAASFAEVHVALPADPAPALLEVALGEDRRVRVWPGFDAETLAQVVRVLEGVRC